MFGVGKIKKWAIMWSSSGFPFVGGEMYDHPNFPDGTEVFTSNVVGYFDNRIVTKSGSCYLLDGPPSKSWLEVYPKVYPDCDPENIEKEFYKKRKR